MVFIIARLLLDLHSPIYSNGFTCSLTECLEDFSISDTLKIYLFTAVGYFLKLCLVYLLFSSVGSHDGSLRVQLGENREKKMIPSDEAIKYYPSK